LDAHIQKKFLRKIMFVWNVRRFLHVRPFAFTSMLDGTFAAFVRA